MFKERVELNPDEQINIYQKYNDRLLISYKHPCVFYIKEVHEETINYHDEILYIFEDSELIQDFSLNNFKYEIVSKQKQTKKTTKKTTKQDKNYVPTVATEKKNKTSDKQLLYSKKYLEKFAEIKLRVTPEEKEKIKALARSKNKSVNQYIIDLII